MPREAELVLAHLALEHKFITQEQLVDGLRQALMLEKSGREASISRLMLSQDFLTAAQLATLEGLARQRNLDHLIAGYKIDGILGFGAMGCVYLARQLSMDRAVALKVLPAALVRDPAWVERFVREARATAKLNHVNIVQGYDVGCSGGLHYFAMEYVDGKNLREILVERGFLPETEACAIVLQVARALQHAWELGIVHRDIKPDNIMVTAAGVAKLTDMGLAKGHEGDGNLTRAGSIVGTPNYISPEQARGITEVDTRSDLYSLGITCYQLLTGQLPFRDPTPTVVMTRHITEKVPSPQLLRPELTPGVCAVVARMTAKELGERYQRPADLVADLSAHLAGRPVTAPAEAPDTLAVGGKFRFCHVPGEDETYFTLIGLKNGVLTVERVQAALDLQEARAEVGVPGSLDQIYVEKGWLTSRQREKILEAQSTHQRKEDEGLFGKMAVKLGLATKAQVKECLSIQEKLKAKGEARRMGDIMLAKEYITFQDKVKVLTEQARSRAEVDNRLFGSIAIKCSFVSQAQLDEALRLQDEEIARRQEAPRLGEILVRRGHIGDEQRRVILRAQRRHEMTGKTVRELIEELATERAQLSYESQAISVGGLFDNVKIKGMAGSAEECPYCGSDIPPGRTRCPRCGKDQF